MVGKPFPSGHLIADRRADFAATMAHLGDMDAAIEILGSALEIAPDWAAGWFRLGEYFEMVGDQEHAIKAWKQVVEHDPSDPFGAGLKIDLLSGQTVSDSAPSAFVEMLFDQYAPRFEASLVEKLEYRAPDLLMQGLLDTGMTAAAKALDLGCGTGLMGERLRPYAEWLGGYDISQGMLNEASEKNLYDLLEKRDLNALEPVQNQYDLIVAADVFIYLGALERIISWTSHALTPNGRFAFTLERGDLPYQLRDSRRFAHSKEYVRDLLQQAGFTHMHLVDCVLRQDRGQDVHGFMVVATRVADQFGRDRDGEQSEFV